MDPVGIWAIALVLVVALVGGVQWKRSNGRLRDVPVDSGRNLSDPAASLAPTQDGVGAGGGVAVDNGRNLSDPAASLGPTQDGVGAGGGVAVDNGRELSEPAALIAPTQDGVGVAAGGRPLDSAMLEGLGVGPGERVTLLQFSSAYCAPCRAVSRISAEVAGEVPGVRHVEVDAEEHLDAVKALGIWRTPTLLVLDREGRVFKRATGVPQKPQLIAAVTETL